MAEIDLLPDSAIPKGFCFAATRAGIKASGRLDLACILADEPVTAAALFTSNRVVAAPLMVGRRHLEASRGRVRAVVVNAGNANCATGEAGIEACEAVCTALARNVGCETTDVFPSSTGIIGVLLPSQKIVDAMPQLLAAMSGTAENFSRFAQAIMTTDTRAKVAHASIELDGIEVRILGTTKGAGMIQPRLTASSHATMLAYITTDALLHKADAEKSLQLAVEQSFNRISIDGDTSTNDTALLLASGKSEARLSSEAARTKFQEALNAVCVSLAKQMVADGEGVGHVIELNIQGASDDKDALQIARSIANSPLVKTAWTGMDPNWGRLLAAIGNADVPIEQDRIDICFGNLEICTAGRVSPSYSEALAHEYLEQAEFSITIDLHLAAGRCRFWTCDLTSEYVSINADYST